MNGERNRGRKGARNESDYSTRLRREHAASIPTFGAAGSLMSAIWSDRFAQADGSKMGVMRLIIRDLP